MQRKQQKRFIPVVLFLAATACIAAALAGCGGSGSSGGNSGTSSPAAGSLQQSGNGTGSGSAVFRIVWPERSSSTRLIPIASESVKIVVLDGEQVLATKIVPRPAEGRSIAAAPAATRADPLPPPGPPVSVVRIEDLPVKTLTDVVTAHPSADGTGVAQAEGRAQVEIRRDETVPVTVVLDSTIDRLALSPAQGRELNTDETLSVTATPRNREGEIVLIRPNSLQWTSSNPTVATVDDQGLVVARQEGGTTIRVTEPESNKTANLAVTVKDSRRFIPATYEAKTFLQPGSNHTYATVMWQKIEGASGYILRGTGGNDPHFWGTQITVRTSGGGFDWPVPEGQIWVGLAALHGSGSDPGDAAGYMDSRFAGFTWEVEVLR